MRSIGFVLIALIGCGGDEGGRHGSVSIMDFGPRIAAAECGKAFECCTTEEVNQYFIGTDFKTEQECVDFITSFYASFLNYQASIDAGKMTYDATKAADCIAGLETASCDQFAHGREALSSCEDFTTGHVAHDGECASDAECTSNYCEGDTVVPVKNGVCKNIPGAGEACTSQCAANLQCQTGTCMPLKADGASCRDRDECMSGSCNGATTSMAGTCGEPMICDGV
jgi:hypothetical protein